MLTKQEFEITPYYIETPSERGVHEPAPPAGVPVPVRRGLVAVHQNGSFREVKFLEASEIGEGFVFGPGSETGLCSSPGEAPLLPHLARKIRYNPLR